MFFPKRRNTLNQMYFTKKIKLNILSILMSLTPIVHSILRVLEIMKLQISLKLQLKIVSWIGVYGYKKQIYKE